MCRHMDHAVEKRRTFGSDVWSAFAHVSILPSHLAPRRVCHSDSCLATSARLRLRRTFHLLPSAVRREASIVSVVLSLAHVLLQGRQALPATYSDGARTFLCARTRSNHQRTFQLVDYGIEWSKTQVLGIIEAEFAYF